MRPRTSPVVHILERMAEEVWRSEPALPHPAEAVEPDQVHPDVIFGREGVKRILHIPEDSCAPEKALSDRGLERREGGRADLGWVPCQKGSRDGLGGALLLPQPVSKIRRNLPPEVVRRGEGGAQPAAQRLLEELEALDPEMNDVQRLG